MIKKILLVSLWTAALMFVATLVVVLLSVAYLRVTLHGARPSEHAHQTMVTLWASVPGITAPIALLIGVFGLLPGTRLQPSSPIPSEWARWCYRLCVAVALFAMLISLWWNSMIWDVLATTPMVFALGVALMDKYAQRRNEPAPR